MLRSISLFAFLGLSLLYLSSYSSGPSGRSEDATGSPLTTTACTTCHNGGNFSPTTAISILDGGSSVSDYEPGKTYTLQLSTTAENSPSGYGFQAVVLDATNGNAGSFGAAPASFRVSTLNSREYFEHSSSQSSSTVEVEWTAPAAGTGDVTVYVGANAIDGGGSTAGDNATLVELTISEGAPSSTSDVNASGEFKAYQTSASSLALELGENLSFPVQYSIQDVSGRVIQSGTTSSFESNVALNGEASAIVMVVIRDAGGRTGAQQIALR